jgi:hypothetical protein
MVSDALATAASSYKHSIPVACDANVIPPRVIDDCSS